MSLAPKQEGKVRTRRSALLAAAALRVHVHTRVYTVLYTTLHMPIYTHIHVQRSEERKEASKEQVVKEEESRASRERGKRRRSAPRERVGEPRKVSLFEREHGVPSRAQFLRELWGPTGMGFCRNN